ncbi:MAG: hypothetical protein ACK44E_12690 [Anaerolineales bacterium]
MISDQYSVSSEQWAVGSGEGLEGKLYNTAAQHGLSSLRAICGEKTVHE